MNLVRKVLLEGKLHVQLTDRLGAKLHMQLTDRLGSKLHMQLTDRPPTIVPEYHPTGTLSWTINADRCEIYGAFRSYNVSLVDARLLVHQYIVGMKVHY